MLASISGVLKPGGPWCGVLFRDAHPPGGKRSTSVGGRLWLEVMLKRVSVQRVFHQCLLVRFATAGWGIICGNWCFLNHLAAFPGPFIVYIFSILWGGVVLSLSVFLYLFFLLLVSPLWCFISLSVALSEFIWLFQPTVTSYRNTPRDL